MAIEIYPEMNETIKKLLRMSQDDSVKAYALARIEELEEDCAYWKMKWRDLVELDDDEE